MYDTDGDRITVTSWMHIAVSLTAESLRWDSHTAPAEACIKSSR